MNLKTFQRSQSPLRSLSVYQHSPTRRQKGPVAAATAIFTASWMSQGHAEPAVAMYALPLVVCQNQEGFVLISVLCFHQELKSTPSKHVLTMHFSEMYHYIGELLPLIPTPPPQFLYLFLSFFVEGKPFLHSGYSADSVRFYSGTTEVRELRGRGKSDRHGKNTNTSYSCFSTRENMSSCESYI